MLPPRLLRRTLPVATAAALLATTLSAVPAAADERRVVVPATRPSWTAAAADLGAAAATTEVQVQVALDLPDEQAAEDFATAVSTPGDPQYGRTLSPAAWIERFAPTQQQVDDVVEVAEEAGLTVSEVPESRLFVLLTGDVSSLNSLFRTRLHAYAVDGDRRLAAAGAVTLPASIASGVDAVSFDHPLVRSRAMRPAAKSSATACSAYWQQHTVRIPKAYGEKKAGTPICGYSAKQLRALYDIDAATGDGRGQTVAVLDAFGSSTIRADLAKYSKANGLPAAQYREHLPPRADWATSDDCSPAGWRTEQTMDLEAIHAVAPRARLVYVGATDCGFGFDVAMSTILDRGLASIVSNSWGSPGLDTAAAQSGAGAAVLAVNVHQHLQAAGQGVGLYFASGDYGDDEVLFGEKAVDFPASSPWVTAVGGTSSGLDRRGHRVFSAPWGATVAVGSRTRWTSKPPGAFAYGAGGGASGVFDRPAYQRVLAGTGIAGGMRASTDVAALASPETGMAVGITEKGRYRVLGGSGGTSLATPIVAAQVAIAQQRAGRPLGFVNPALYRAAAAGRTRDVRPSDTRRFVAAVGKGRTVLVTIDRDSSLQARAGYDYPTGVGELTSATLRYLAGR